MPYVWLLLLACLVVVLLFGDVKARHAVRITQDKAAAIHYKTWPTWTLEPSDTRIRMLWIIHDYVPFVNAGSEICAHTLNQYFVSKPYKYDVIVASPGYPQKVYEGVRCFDLYDTETLFKVIPTVHMFHSHSYVYRKQMLWLSRVTGKPFVEWVHTDNYVRSIGKQWYDNRIHGRQWTVFNADSLRKARPDLSDDHLRVIKPVVDYREYAIDEEAKKPIYVTLSNVNANKGGYLLIELAKALPELEFQGIIGGYRKQIFDSSVPNLKYIRHTTEIKDVYAQTWVLIMPSKEETWGRTAVEAMSSGIPVVVSPTPGLKECCGDAAIYCDVEDLDAWVSALRRLKTDREFYNSRARLALERARALDPNPGLADMEQWVEHTVYPSAVPSTQSIGLLEKNMLFR
jgi:glycosyltransferase involved in cell wall biosynthesis